MKLLRVRFKGRVKCLLLLVAAVLVFLIGFYANEKHHPKRYRICSSSDDPLCILPELRLTDFPSTKRRPRLDSGAQWCRDADLERPRFPLGHESQEWQDVRDRNVKVFSAFFDNRRKLGGPLIRIIASGLQQKFNDIGQLHCTLWYEDSDIPVTVGPAIYDLIYPSTLYPQMWVAHFILCPVPVTGDLGIPNAVSVTARSCDPPSNALMVLNRLPESVDEFSFAACFPPVYGKSLDSMVFVEWIELHKILGMKSAYFYDHSMPGNVNRVLNGYQSNRSEHVHVIRWKFPSDKLINYFSQHSAINDCLYRAGHTHQFVAVMDIDEVMTPRVHTNWPEMMKHLFKRNIGAYLFQHAYFRRNSTGERPYLITQQSLWRTDVVTPAGKIRCKSMYRVSEAIKANIHFPYRLMDRAEEYLVPPEVAMLHHYRIDPMETFRKHPEKFRFIEDKHMLRYKKMLNEAVLTRIQSLHLNTTNIP